VFPTLAGSELVNAENPNGLIEIILNGARLPSTPKAPTRLTMPDFGWRLNDQQIADLATFVRGGWGNRAGAVSASDVRQVRSDLPKPVIPSKPRDEDGVEAYAGK
jgi:mono/diheme cytochrome c family protein